jgi:hypothetical protein
MKKISVKKSQATVLKMDKFGGQVEGQKKPVSCDITGLSSMEQDFLAGYKKCTY